MHRRRGGRARDAYRRQSRRRRGKRRRSDGRRRQCRGPARMDRTNRRHLRLRHDLRADRGQADLGAGGSWGTARQEHPTAHPRLSPDAPWRAGRRCTAAAHRRKTTRLAVILGSADRRGRSWRSVASGCCTSDRRCRPQLAWRRLLHLVLSHRRRHRRRRLRPCCAARDRRALFPPPVAPPPAAPPAATPAPAVAPPAPTPRPYIAAEVPFVPLWRELAPRGLRPGRGRQGHGDQRARLVRHCHAHARRDVGAAPGPRGVQCAWSSAKCRSRAISTAA